MRRWGYHRAHFQCGSREKDPRPAPAATILSHQNIGRRAAVPPEILEILNSDPPWACLPVACRLLLLARNGNPAADASKGMQTKLPKQLADCHPFALPCPQKVLDIIATYVDVNGDGHVSAQELLVHVLLVIHCRHRPSPHPYPDPVLVGT